MELAQEKRFMMDAWGPENWGDFFVNFGGGSNSVHIWEYYCSVNGGSSIKLFKYNRCPKGYSCANGACTLSPPSSDYEEPIDGATR